MTDPTGLAGLATEKFVALTTFRRTGEPVATPVWIAPDGDALVVTTGSGTGKVKRIRHTPRVQLQPCSRRGIVAPGAPTVEAVAEVVAVTSSATSALRRKYGLQFAALMLGERLVGRFRPRESVIVRITARAG